MSAVQYRMTIHRVLHATTEEVGITTISSSNRKNPEQLLSLLHAAHAHTHAQVLPERKPQEQLELQTTSTTIHQNNSKNKNNNNINSSQPQSPQRIDSFHTLLEPSTSISTSISTSTSATNTLQTNIITSSHHATITTGEADAANEEDHLRVKQQLGAVAIGVMCLERSGSSCSSGSKNHHDRQQHHPQPHPSSGQQSPNSPSTISTRSLLFSSSSPSSSAAAAADIPREGSIKAHQNNDEVHTTNSNAQTSTNIPTATATVDITNNATLEPSSSVAARNKQQQKQEQRSYTSILRKSKFSPEAATTPSPRPSTGQKVRGLWSPSVDFCEDVSPTKKTASGVLVKGEHQISISSRAESSSSTSIPLLPLAPVLGVSHRAQEFPQDQQRIRINSSSGTSTTTTSSVSLMESMRDETLSQLLGYLQLADLLRAGMVSKRWRHEVHNAGRGMTTKTMEWQGVVGTNHNINNNTKKINNKNISTATEHQHRHRHRHQQPYRHRLIHLWERVDATSFIEETYDRFLGIAKERECKLQQQQQQLLHLKLAGSPTRDPEPVLTGRTAKKRHKNKKDQAIDPPQWARLQTGLALGRLLRSKTTTAVLSQKSKHLPKLCSKSEAAATSTAKPFFISSLVIRNIGDKLSPDRLDDFLPASVLSSLRHLTLEGFDKLTDTHVHVLLLATLGGGRTTTTNTNTMNRKRQSQKHHSSKLEELVLENCPKLTRKVLSSVATTCSHKHLRKLSVKGCPKIDSINALSELLVTKLVLPSNNHSNISSIRSSEALSRGTTQPRIVMQNQPKPTMFLPFVGEQRTLPSTVVSLLDSKDFTDAGDGLESSSSNNPAALAASLFLPHKTEPAATGKRRESEGGSGSLSTLFAQPSQRRQQEREQQQEFHTTAVKKRVVPVGLASLFAPQQQTPQSLSSIRPKDVATAATTTTGLSSLFAPPPSPQRTSPTKLPPTGVDSLFVLPSKSSLASLFDLPGTSPTRRNNADSMLILPPPPSLPSFRTEEATDNFPLAQQHQSSSQQQQQQHQHQHTSHGSSPSISKRYHRHQRSLSNGKLPFPPALLQNICDSHSDSDSNSNHTYHRVDTVPHYHSNQMSATAPPLPSTQLLRSRTTMVGSLGYLDLRGTALTPSGLVDCLWALTHHNLHHHHHHHHHHGVADQRSWCKVWFEALHLSDAAPAEEESTNNSKSNSNHHKTLRHRHQHQLEHDYRWNIEHLDRLETALAMDEMERKNGTSNSNMSSSSLGDGGSRCSSAEVSYVASRGQRSENV